MPMSNNGLSKLIEECGEVLQIAGKLLAYPDGQHPDGNGNLHERLEQELADLSAAAAFVVQTHNLNGKAIGDRAALKLHRFQVWHADPKS